MRPAEGARALGLDDQSADVEMGDEDFAPGHLVVDVGEPQPTTSLQRRTSHSHHF
jgi:hypothetical protein